MKDPDDRNTLLIVEDHETLRHYLRQTFEHLYRVIDVADGHEAIACLANEYPDIILSDVMMPGIRVTSFAEWSRKILTHQVFPSFC